MEEGKEEISTKKLLARIALRFLLVVVILYICFKFGRILSDFFLPFLLAYLVSAVFLIPIIRKLSGRFEHFRKFWSIVFVISIMCIAALMLGGILYYLIQQIMDMIKNWDFYLKGLEELVQSIARFVSARTNMTYETVLKYMYSLVDDIMDWATKYLPGTANAIVDSIGNYAPTIGSFFLGFLFFLMATYFICADYPIIRRKIKRVVPEGVKPHIEQIKKAAGSATFGYLKAQFIVSGMVALIAFVVLLIIGQSYAALFGLLIGFVDFIPLLGSSVILVPWIILLVVAGNYTKAVVLGILTAGLFLFRRIVEPKIVGDQTGLHPLVSLITLYIGIKCGGLIGMIITPILCMILIGLYNVGFFKPTVNDLKMLLKRATDYAEM
ncbi:MAG: sporulation integral membrane protein YtvI [Lachnospiraceae bacterium]